MAQVVSFGGHSGRACNRCRVGAFCRAKTSDGRSAAIKKIHRESSGPTGPRTPQRANGRRRLDLLLDAAERLLQSSGNLPLTIQSLAREAGVPMASVYHYLPHPSAVSIALSERYFDGLEACICARITKLEARKWHEIVAILNKRAVRYYRQRPYAQTLILGSDHSWAIRQADLANNRRIALAITDFLAAKFPEATQEDLLRIVVTGITIGDAVFSLSIGESGEITEVMAGEAWFAVCAYLAAIFGRDPPSVSDY